MKVKEVMTRDVRACQLSTSLAEAASSLWDSDCGVLPVVDEQGKVISMISDRDICMAVVTKNRLASEITVGEVVSGNSVVSSNPDERIEQALSQMQEHQVRRLPVVDKGGKLQGILSINDVILASGDGGQSIPINETLRTLQAISQHEHRGQPRAGREAQRATQG